jgi:GGDEF domain-containing protein
MHVDVSGLQVDPLTGLPNRGMFDAHSNSPFRWRVTSVAGPES